MIDPVEDLNQLLLRCPRETQLSLVGGIMALHIMERKFAVVQVRDFWWYIVTHILCYTTKELKSNSVDAAAIHVCGTKQDCYIVPVVGLCIPP